MMIEVRSCGSGRVCRLAPKAFGKLLHLARFHGWKPEQVNSEWPSETWNTEIVLPHVGAYMTGRVSQSDAGQLCAALGRVIDSESSGLDQRLYFAALGLVEVTKSGEFEVLLSEESVALSGKR
ncbi:MAG: hypothetical protein ACO34E_16470 [Limisphaerales bacterium]